MRLAKLLTLIFGLCAALQPFPAAAQNPFGGLNSALGSSSETTEGYHIIDLKTGVDKITLFKAVERGAKSNAPSIQISRPLVMGALPDKPGQFVIVNALEALGANGANGGNLGGLLALAGPQAMQQANSVDCKGAHFVGRAERKTTTQMMNLFVCVYPYTEGYSLQVYTNNTKSRSGGMRGLIEKGVASALGDEEKWALITVQKMVDEVIGTGPMTAAYVEGTGGITLPEASAPAPAPSEQAAPAIAPPVEPAQPAPAASE